MKRKISIFISLILFPASVFHQSECFKLDAKLKDEKWQCGTICTESGGKVEFDAASKICKCLLGGNIDDKDVEVLKKNAMSVGIILETISPTSSVGAVLKREIRTKAVENELTTSQPITSTTLSEESTEITTFVNKNVGGIVGQRSPVSPPQRRTPTAGRSAGSALISPDQQRQAQIIQQIRDRLTRLNQNTLDQRGRQLEVDAIRILLRQLSQSIGVPEPPQSRRSDRLRSIVQQVRERQNRHRSAQGPRVGGLFLNPSSDKDANDRLDENEANENDIQDVKKPGHFFDIITQDPRLIDD